MFSKTKSGGIATHVFFFFLFLVVPVLVFPRPPGMPFFSNGRAFLQDTVANSMLLCFFYLNYYIFIPRFYFRHKYLAYFGCVLLSLTIAAELPHLLISDLLKINTEFVVPRFDPHTPPMHSHSNQSHLYYVFDEMRRHIYLFFTATFFSFLLRIRERLSQVKAEKLEAELSSLKTQINPHFLFNTLNSIYALSVKKDDRASEAIIHLSGLMRYVIKDANDYKIPLQKEIDYIRNYIELQKARLGNTTYVRYECSGDAANKTIAPLILITYIENAFKYGINPDVDDCIVEITLQVTTEGVRLYVFNKKVQQALDADSTGIGMNNTGERLQLLYPGKHDLQVSENKETYSVTLSLQLV
jgi:hypothetical protein